jgi:hypothetical protein
MALVLADRVRDTTTTTGTGTVTLSGTAPTGYQDFSVIGNANTTYYTINAGSQWEVGIGTYSSTGPTLARNTVLESSNANALVNFSAGTKDVFVTYPSDKAVTTDGVETLTNKTINGSNNTITNVSLTSAVTGTLPVANGGTGLTSYAIGDILFASTATTLSKLADVATGNALISGGVGVAPAYGKIGLTTHISGTLAVGNGGTGVTTSTGTTSVVLSNSPTLVTPTLGAASATSIANGLGAVGTPSYTFTGDTNTGMWSPGADTIAFSEGGVEAMRIDSDGDVGIGTTAPVQRLHVRQDQDGTTAALIQNRNASGTPISAIQFISGAFDLSDNRYAMISSAGGSNTTLQFWTGSGATPTERMRITSAGNVGIGTTAPTTIFHVQQNTTANVGMRMRQLSTTQFAGAGLLCNGPVSSGVQGGTAFYHYNRNTGGTNGALAMAQFDENGSYQRSLAEYYYNEQAWLFYTNGSERLRITSAGNVGIGTSSPLYQTTVLGLGQETAALTDAGNKGGSLYLQATGVTSGSGGAVLFGTTFGNQTPFAAIKGLVTDGATNTNGDLAFSTRNAPSDTALTERMRITSAGNVGIGTSAPDRKLDVQGSGSITVRSRSTDTTGVTVGILAAEHASGSSLQARAGVGFTNLISTGAADPLILSTNSTERMRITSAGNVGIGMTAPPQLLAVGNTTDQVGAGISAAVSTLYFGSPSTGSGGIRRLAYDRATGNFDFIGNSVASPSTQMTITGTGNVGIGTTSPGSKLDVLGDFVARTDASGGNTPLNVKNDSTANNTTKSTALRFQGVDTVGTSKNVGLVQCGPDEGNYVASYLAFQTRTADALSERMRITSGGNVGIGTSSPSVKLDVNGSANFGATITTGTGVSTGDAHLELGGNRTGSGNAYIDLHAVTGTDFEARIIRYGGANSSLEINNTGTGGMQLNNSGAAPMVFYTTATERMRIASDGTMTLNVGGVSSTHSFLYNESGGEIQLVDSTGAGPILIDNISGLARFYKVGTGAMSIGTTGANYLQYVTNSTERMRIDSSGNVGIGTSSPSYRLDIAAGDTTASLGYAMRIRSNATATAATLQFTNSAVTAQNGVIICTDAGGMIMQSDGASSFLAFRTNGNERVRIDSTGSVGIGTSSPDVSALLDVSSTTKGFLPPRMSTAQRDAIGGATQEGLIIYNVTTDKLQVFAAGAWVNLH